MRGKQVFGNSGIFFLCYLIYFQCVYALYISTKTVYTRPCSKRSQNQRVSTGEVSCCPSRWRREELPYLLLHACGHFFTGQGDVWPPGPYSVPVSQFGMLRSHTLWHAVSDCSSGGKRRNLSHDRNYFRNYSRRPLPVRFCCRGSRGFVVVCFMTPRRVLCVISLCFHSNAFYLLMPQCCWTLTSACLCPSYLNGRFGQDDMVQHWSEKYNEVSNAMDMVGFEEQVKYVTHNKCPVFKHTVPKPLGAYTCSRMALSGKGGHDDYPRRHPVSGKYHVRADWEWCPESERDLEGLAQSHRGELAQVQR